METSLVDWHSSLNYSARCKTFKHPLDTYIAIWQYQSMLNNDPTYRLEEARRIVESRISPRPASPRHTGRLRMRLLGPRGAQRRA